MNRSGSIIILALIITLIIFISVSYLVYLTSLQTSILHSSSNKIQSLYLAESKINEVFYSDECFKNQIIPGAIQYLRAPSNLKYSKITIPIDMSFLVEDDEEQFVSVEYSKPKGKPFVVELFAKSNYKGVENKIMAYGPLLNPLFDNIDATLYSYDSDFKTVVKLESFLDGVQKDICIKDIPSTMVGINTFDHDNITVGYKNSTTNVIRTFRNGNKTQESEIKDDIMLVVKNKLNTPITLNIGDSQQTNLIKLRGLIYLEGDIIIRSKFQFTGIIILNDGNIIVDTDARPLFKGIILTNAYTNLQDRIDMVTAYDEVCKYGTYLPGFLQPRIEVVKKY